MRKQYHFRPSANGLYAWDVDVLVNLTEELQVKTISLSEIKEFDENWWFADKDNNPTCRAITEHFKLINACDIS